jgi:hypothetical protein
MTPPLSRLRTSDHYLHLAIRNEAGGVEHWLLTANEVERIRERSAKHPHLALPVVPEEPQGWWARFRTWVTSG